MRYTTPVSCIICHDSVKVESRTLIRARLASSPVLSHAAAAMAAVPTRITMMRARVDLFGIFLPAALDRAGSRNSLDLFRARHDWWQSSLL